MTAETRFEGELIAGQHNPATRAAIMKVTTIAGSPVPGIRDVVAYFDSAERAAFAAATLAAEAAAGPFPDTRFEVIRARGSHR
jgi:hypothetical protein